MTPLAVSKPNALPPESTMAFTRSTVLIGLSRSVSRVPGAEPRTSTPPIAPWSNRTTVQPVGRRLSVKCPTRTPSISVMPPDGSLVAAPSPYGRAAKPAAARNKLRLEFLGLCMMIDLGAYAFQFLSSLGRGQCVRPLLDAQLSGPNPAEHPRSFDPDRIPSEYGGLWSAALRILFCLCGLHVGGRLDAGPLWN